MIKRFVTVSIGLHALAGTLLLRPPMSVPIEVPTLDIAFSRGTESAREATPSPPRSTVAADASRPRGVAAPITRAPIIASQGAGDRAVETQPTGDRTSQAAVVDNPPERVAESSDRSDGGEARRANHLLSQLHAAVDEYFIYPPLARRHGWQGTVYVGLRLNTNGELDALRLVRSSGYAILDRDALATLARIGTLPQARAWLEGRPFEAELTVIYRLVGS